MKKDLKKRVNLGSGKDYLKGWINVDIDPHVKVDVIADLSEKFPFESESIDEIKASDILEHFTKEDGEKFLEECRRVLTPKGKIEIRTHNIYQIYEQFSNDPGVLTHFIYGDTSETGIFGSHKYAYTRESLTKVLKKVGFSVVNFTYETTNHLVIAQKTKQRSKNLSIAVIMQSPDIGGAEIYMHSLVSEFIRKGNSVTLATNNKKFSGMFDQLPIGKDSIPYILDIIGNWKGLIKSILVLPFATFFYIRLLTNYKRKNIDVILMSNFSEKLLVTSLSFFFRIPVVWIEYGRLGTIFKNNFYLPKIIYRSLTDIPKNIIVPTQNTKMSLITDARTSLSKLTVIPCGTTPISKSSTSKSLSQQVKGKVVIGNVSRMTKEKGQHLIINAAPLIIKRVPNALFILVGDGPDKKYFESLIKKQGLQKYFLLPGFVKNKYEYLSVMDIFIFPTIWELEGFGVVLVEAMMMGIPVVASNFGPVPEIIDDEMTGLLFDVTSKESLAEAVIRLKTNSKLRNTLKKNALKKAKERFDIDPISDKVLAVLYDALF